MELSKMKGFAMSKKRGKLRDSNLLIENKLLSLIFIIISIYFLFISFFFKKILSIKYPKSKIAKSKSQIFFFSSQTQENK